MVHFSWIVSVEVILARVSFKLEKVCTFLLLIASCFLMNKYIVSSKLFHGGGTYGAYGWAFWKFCEGDAYEDCALLLFIKLKFEWFS